MTKEISKEMVCVIMRNGVEIWLEKERAQNLNSKLLKQDKSQFVEFEGRVLNTADITGVFTAKDMEETTRRKNGQWKCEKGKWHDKNKGCDCPRDFTSEEMVRISTGGRI